MEISHLRLRAALRLAQGAGFLSRRAGRGSGIAISGRILTALAPDSLADLSGGLECVLISATNGKTTTTAMCNAVLASRYRTVSNSLGNNMTGGLVEALSRRGNADHAVLEVDESHLGLAIQATAPVAVVLMNLSRDQLDRVSEVRAVAARWLAALADAPNVKVIANVSDPLVYFAVAGHELLVSVDLGSPWSLDASVCPRCDAPLEYSPDSRYHCSVCAFAMPECEYRLEGGMVKFRDNPVVKIESSLPGDFNLRNAAIAAVLGVEMGVSPAEIAEALASVASVAGRYETLKIANHDVMLLMAKNPAGWQATIAMLGGDSRDLVLAINAEIADGKDTSWLYDVDFSPLANRRVVVTGSRRSDLATRLFYDGVPHAVVVDPIAAIASLDTPEVVFVGNYTAFQGLRRSLASRDPGLEVAT